MVGQGNDILPTKVLNAKSTTTSVYVVHKGGKAYLLEKSVFNVHFVKHFFDFSS